MDWSPEYYKDQGFVHAVNAASSRVPPTSVLGSTVDQEEKVRQALIRIVGGSRMEIFWARAFSPESKAILYPDKTAYFNVRLMPRGHLDINSCTSKNRPDAVVG